MNQASNESGRRVMMHSGVLFDPDAPDPRSIRLVDIAHHLAREPRFGGATSKYYSVAEHSCRVSALVAEWGGGPVPQLEGLLHDAAEAYVGDIPRPRKTPDDVLREERVLLAISLAVDFSLAPLSPVIKPADNAMLDREAASLMPVRWFELAGRKQPKERLPFGHGWDWHTAAFNFLEFWKSLARELRLPETAAWEGISREGL